MNAIEGKCMVGRKKWLDLDNYLSNKTKVNILFVRPNHIIKKS